MKIHHPHTYYWMMRHRLSRVWPESSEFNGFTIYHTPDTMPYPASFLRHVAPREMYDLLEKEAGKTAIDAGACIGFYSLLFSKNFEHVYGFEPHPKNMRMYQKNINTNNMESKIHPEQYALSSQNGAASFYVKDYYKASSSLTRNHLDQPLNDSILVRIRTLDSFRFVEPVDLLKIDVEGEEINVLKGGNILIREQHPTLAVEVHRDPIGTPCRCECCNLIGQLGYNIEETRFHKASGPDIKDTTIHWVLAR